MFPNLGDVRTMGALGGLIWYWFWFAAVFGLVFVIADYLLKKERLEFITAEDLEQGKHVKP